MVLVLFAIGVFGTQTTPAQELFTDKSDIAVTEVDRMVRERIATSHSVPSRGWALVRRSGNGGEPAVVGLAVIGMLAHGDDPTRSLRSVRQTRFGFHSQTGEQANRLHRPFHVQSWLRHARLGGSLRDGAV